MKRFKPLFLLLAAMAGGHLALANNGGSSEKKTPVGSVEGYVTDAVSGKPINGVTVSASFRKAQAGKEIVSDAAGHFNFAKLPAGEVTLVFEKKGYKFFKKNVLSVKDGAVTSIKVEVHPITDSEDGGTEIWHPLFRLLD